MTDDSLERATRVIQESFAQVLEVPHAGPDESFFELGAGDADVPRLLTLTEQRLGAPLSFEDVLAGRTPRSLAALSLCSRTERDATAHLLRLSKSGTGAPVFCVHPGTGLAWAYLALRRHLRGIAPVHGLQSPWLHGGAGADTVDQLAARYAETIRRTQPSGPYRVLGWSFGGNVAVAIAALLRRAGEEVALLALVDSAPPHIQRPQVEASEAQVLRDVMMLMNCPLPGDRVTHDEFVRTLLAPTGPLAGLPAGTVSRLPGIYRRHTAMLYEPSETVFDGDMVFFSAVPSPVFRPLRGESWRPHVEGRITEVALPAPHVDVLSGDSLDIVGETLRQHLLTEER